MEKNTGTLQKISILIVDSDSNQLRHLKGSFQKKGARVFLASDMESAKVALSKAQVNIVLCDYFIKNGKFSELFIFSKREQPKSLFYLMSEIAPSELSDQSSMSLVDRFFSKPVDVEALVQHTRTIFPEPETSLSTLDPLTSLLQPYLVFRSTLMRRSLTTIPQIARSNHSVLITGETGTGKELVAHAIHGLSEFNSGPFIAVNCGAIPESLIEGELFGHEKGAFTGAQGTHKGKFELANNGTLFLDEIGEMPLILQARLLRVLETSSFYRVGGEKPISLNLRIIAATQVNLENAINDRLFRDDLYYRLNVLRVHIPALRDRTEDIALLAWHFLERAFGEINRRKPYPVLSAEMIALLSGLPWKGNVRELRNIITRIAVLLPPETREIQPKSFADFFPEISNASADAVPISEKKIPSIQELEGELIELKSANGDKAHYFPDEAGSDGGIYIAYESTLKEAQQIIINETLKYYQGNRTKTAKSLDIGLRTIRRKLNQD